MDEFENQPQPVEASNVASSGTDSYVAPVNAIVGGGKFWLRWSIAGVIAIIILTGGALYLYGLNNQNHIKTLETPKSSANDVGTASSSCKSISQIADISKDLELSDHHMYKLLSLKGSQTADHPPYCLPNGDNVEFWLQGDGAQFKNVNNVATLDQAMNDYANWQSAMNKKKVISPVERISSGVYLYGLQSDFSTEYTIWIVSNISGDYPLGDAADNDTDYPSSFAISIEGANSGKYNSEVLDLTKKIAKSVVVKW